MSSIRRLFNRIGSRIRAHRLYRAYPKLADLDRAISEAKRRKKKYSHLEREKRDFITSVLAGRQ